MHHHAVEHLAACGIFVKAFVQKLSQKLPALRNTEGVSVRGAHDGRVVVTYPRHQIAHAGQPQARDLRIARTIGELINRTRHEAAFDMQAHRVRRQYAVAQARIGPIGLRNLARRQAARRADAQFVGGVAHTIYSIGNRRAVAE